LVIAVGRHQALFLPSVWEQLPDPEQFLDHLWIKAGLRSGEWPAGLRCYHFTTQHHRRRARTPCTDAAA
jgi:AMMECR1 domain-containing protein